MRFHIANLPDFVDRGCKFEGQAYEETSLVFLVLGSVFRIAMDSFALLTRTPSSVLYLFQSTVLL